MVLHPLYENFGLLDGAGASHDASGALAADAATVAGAAAHLTLHATSGALVAGSAAAAGDADHAVPGAVHTTSGALAADDATAAGSAEHLTLHATSGALAADAASVAGTAEAQFATSGALVSDAAIVAGDAGHTAAGTHDASGDLVAGDAQVVGDALAEHVAIVSLGGRGHRIDRLYKTHRGFHEDARGALVAGSASVTGRAGRVPLATRAFGAKIREAANFKPPTPARPPPNPAPNPAPAIPVLVRSEAPPVLIRTPMNTEQRITQLERRLRALERHRPTKGQP